MTLYQLLHYVAFCVVWQDDYEWSI